MTYVEGLFWTVEVMVSRELAVRYVPPYSMHTRANGFENMRECGRRIKLVREDLRESLSLFWPEAFCMIALSMIAMMGATMQAAEKPATESDANRRPRFLVFHVLGSSNCDFEARVMTAFGVDASTAILGVTIPTPGTLGVILDSLMSYISDSLVGIRIEVVS